MQLVTELAKAIIYLFNLWNSWYCFFRISSKPVLGLGSTFHEYQIERALIIPAYEIFDENALSSKIVNGRLFTQKGNDNISHVLTL